MRSLGCNNLENKNCKKKCLKFQNICNLFKSEWTVEHLHGLIYMNHLDVVCVLWMMSLLLSIRSVSIRSRAGSQIRDWCSKNWPERWLTILVNMFGEKGLEAERWRRLYVVWITKQQSQKSVCTFQMSTKRLAWTLTLRDLSFCEEYISLSLSNVNVTSVHLSAKTLCRKWLALVLILK